MLKQLLKDMDSPDATVREAAICQARALPVDQLLKLAKMEALSSRPSYLFAGIKLLFMEMFLLLVIKLVGNIPLLGWLRSEFSGIFGGSSLLLFAYCLYGKPPNARRSMTTIVEGLDDARLLPLALNLLEHPYFGTQECARKALLRLLPSLRPGLAIRFTKGQREALRRCFSSPISNFELTLVVLKALEQIGNAEDLPAVRKLATMRMDGNLWMRPFSISLPEAAKPVRQIQQAAQECLPYLEAHHEEQMQMQTLLRPADSAIPDILLRPTISPDATKVEELVRPSARSNPQ